MSEYEGYISVNRKNFGLLWDVMGTKVATTLLDLVLRANTKDDSILKRGQLAASVHELAAFNKKEVAETEKALQKLKKAGEIATKKTRGGALLITILHYDDSPYWVVEDGD